MSQMSQVLRESAIGMLPAGKSTRAAVRECNVYFYTIIHLQCPFREFGSKSNRPHNCRQVYCVVWASSILSQSCEQSFQWWRWGYGMGSHKLWTMNTIAFYRCQFECTELLGGPFILKGVFDQTDASVFPVM